ncbi:MAG: hypothetical protein JSS49_03695 [Planctomycetes bacterium]|nr:hypothetical protein [Planctomycetota bacterium]
MDDTQSHLHTGIDAQPFRPTSATGRAAVICSTLGCLGWIGLVPFLDACDQGEQLARFFAQLFNIIVISVVGGVSTILMLVGWWMSRRARRNGESKPARTAGMILMTGTVVGLLVIVFYLLPALFA